MNWLDYMPCAVGRFLVSDERGATAAEYALVITLMAGVIFLAVAAVGGAVSSLFTYVAELCEGIMVP